MQRYRASVNLTLSRKLGAPPMAKALPTLLSPRCRPIPKIPSSPVIKDILWQDGQGDRLEPDNVPAFKDPAAMFGNKWYGSPSDQPGQKG